MTPAPTTSRRLITALLIAWLPICCCQAAGVIHLGLSLAGLAATADEPCCPCCQSDAPDEAPAPTDSCADCCCTAGAKIAPKTDRWSPDHDAAPIPIPLAVAHAVLSAQPSLSPHPRATESPPLSDSQTLLRRRCALLI